MSLPLSVHIMTAALWPGDAIGNYVLTLRRLLIGLGCRVRLYADATSPEFPAPAYPSHLYQSTGRDLLWYHYSVGADNLACIAASADFRLMDFHGVSPPRLFAGYDAHLAERCREGERRLPEMRDQFDLCVAHSNYAMRVLADSGYHRARMLPLVVDTDRFDGMEDQMLSNWARQIDYWLFVGRVVPQKDILSLLRVFAEFHKAHPDAVLIIVGGRHLAPGYQRRLDRAVARWRLERRVLFLGQVSHPALLTSLYRHAHFTLVTSEWESFCVPVVESMHFGTPVVAHDVPPVPEVMGAGGIVIDKRDPRRAAEQIDAVWREPARREELRAAARARARHFTADVLRAELLALFRSEFA